MCFRYPDSEKYALDNVTFTVNEGELVLLCGRSGSGKTTLLRLLKRRLAPFGELSGSILIGGKKAEELTERTAVSEVGCVAQNVEAQLVAETVWRELAFGLESLGSSRSEIRRKTAEISLYYGIEDLYRRRISSLSGGEKQLVNLAAATVCEPSLLLLDEPTAQLDPIASKSLISQVMRLNRELGVTVVICEHRSDEIFPYADRVLCLENGRLIADAPPKEAAGKSCFFIGAMPAAARVFHTLGGSGVCPITTAQCRSFLSDNYVFSNLPAATVNKNSPAKPAIKLDDVFFRYSKDSPDVLSGLSLSVYKGEVLSILGGNGAGKSTLLKVISGVYKPYSGKLLLSGKNATKRGDIRTALLPQSPRELFVTPTVRDDLIEAAKAAGALPSGGDVTDEIEAVSKKLGIAHLLDRHPYDLSGGEQQKAAIAKLLLLKPDVMLLDEPTKGMDLEAKQTSAKLVNKLKTIGVTVVIVTHDAQTAALCSDRCALLFDGAIACTDTPGQFFSGLSYFTTPEAHIARGLIPGAVTTEDIAASCRKK